MSDSAAQHGLDASDRTAPRHGIEASDSTAPRHGIDASDSTAPRHDLAALIVGIVLGTTSAAGIALLLYTGSGFLKAAGLLVSSTLMATAAGVWAGGDEHAPLRGRWIALGLALIAAGIFATFWGEREGLRALALGGALAVLLVLAFPAYAAGLALSALHARSREGGIAAAAAAGAALGILGATTLLIQLLEPFAIFYGSAFVVSTTALLTRDAARPSRHGESHMHDHVTLITGVGSADQLGFTIARRFARAGARVIITSRGADVSDVAAAAAGATAAGEANSAAETAAAGAGVRDSQRTAASIASALADDGRVVGLYADLSKDEDVHALVEDVRTRFGRLDSLVNTAGGLTHIASVQDTTPEQWRDEIERNAGTALRLCRAALPLLRASRGAIINFASPAGERAAANLAAYSAAKAAVIALTRALALEERVHGVRVNAIAPGMMDTPANRVAAGADATLVPREDVAAVAFFLATPDARAVSGQVIHVPGDTLE